MKIKNMIKTNAIHKYRKSLAVMLASLLLASSLPVSGGTILGSTSATMAVAAQFDLGSPLPFPFNGALSSSASAFPTMAAAQGSNFIYVISSLQSLGNVCLPGGVCKGPFAEYKFNLPSNTVGRGQVMLQASHVNVGCNTFTINGTQINVLINRNGSGELHVEMNDIPSGVLKPGENTLFIQSRSSSCTVTGDIDDFRITNVAVTYQIQ
jgi:hypothetical protein